MSEAGPVRPAAALAGLILLASSFVLRADDIDIYRDGAGIGRPWVHVLLDLRGGANDPVLCTFGEDCQPPFLSRRAYYFLGQRQSVGESVTATAILRAVLAAVFDDPRFDDVRVSLIMPNHPDNAITGGVTGAGGATILAGYSRLGDSREALSQKLQAIPLATVPDDQALQPREALYEWYRYINGNSVALGTNTGGNFGETNPSPDYDPDIIAGTDYLSPFTGQDECPRLFGVLALLGPTGEDSALDTQISQSLAVPPGSGFAHLLALMHHPDTDLLPSLPSPVRIGSTLILSIRDQADLARSYAEAGSGAVHFLEQPREAEAALRIFFDQAMAADASFAAASVAVDVLETGNLLDRYYVSLFQVSGGVSWRGNVKKFRFQTTVQGEDNRPLSMLVDVRGAPALESVGSGRGKIAFDALSFWTDPASLPPGDGFTVPVNADGRVVDRGGAGQKIDGFISLGPEAYPVIGDINAGGESATRQVYVEPIEPGPFIPFNADVPTLELLRQELDPGLAMSDAELINLIRWGRGQDVDGGTGGAKSWLLGGVIHSRPLAVNYGATPGYSRENPNVRLFFGSTDGLFHILEDTDVQGRQSGRERFAFYPLQLLKNLSSLREGVGNPGAVPYGVDGAPVLLRVDKDGDGTIEPGEGDEVYVFFGLRRGGRGYYALDVSDPGLPPRLAWKLSPGSEFSELALGFSTPLVGRVKFEATPRDVIIFGAGYNGGWSTDGKSRIGKDLGYEDDALGNAIYIVDARSGELIWKAVRGTTGSASEMHYEHAGLKDSIPSPVAALRTSEGIIHRLYVGDTGGTVWRVDLPPGAAPGHRRDHWFIGKLADLGADPGEPGGSDARDLRFFHRPEIVRSFDALGAFDGILIQSGDRARPRDTGARNHLFYIKDRKLASEVGSLGVDDRERGPATHYRFEDLADQTTCIRGTEIDAFGTSCRERPLAAGWKLRFSRPGEKGLSRPLVDGGRVLATTYTPTVEKACAPAEGQGHLYAVNLADATALVGGVRAFELGRGIPPEPVHLGDGILVPGGGVDWGGINPGNVDGMDKLIPTTAPQRYRVYWREPAMDPF